jgi:hypothetical protein
MLAVPSGRKRRSTMTTETTAKTTVVETDKSGTTVTQVDGEALYIETLLALADLWTPDLYAFTTEEPTIECAPIAACECIYCGHGCNGETGLSAHACSPDWLDLGGICESPHLGDILVRCYLDCEVCQ